MTTSTSVHSNAFNFMSYLESGVDPRTGQYTVAITLPDVKTNDLRGPGMPLALIYNPLNTQDSGFGLGWNLQLSQYTPGSRILSLSTGETFKVTGTQGMQLSMEEKKIDNFHFYEISSTRFQVVHKSGLVEILEVRGSSQNRVALPVEIYAPEGHKVTLEYATFSGTHQILQSIKDDSGRILLSVARVGASVEILLAPQSGPDDAPLARFGMTLQSGANYVTKITLPTEEKASWRFAYTQKGDQYCISSVETPTGGREEILYGDNGHEFPAGSGRQPLPRVTQHRTYPGFEQPMVEVKYDYPGGKNFLGFGLSLSWSDDGLDNLYKYIGSYEYRSMETLMVDGQEARTIERKFNQFHLLTHEITTRNQHVKTVETTYYLRPGIAFKDQYNYCQLPKEVKTTWSAGGRNRPEPLVSSEYDNHGNLIKQTHATGVVETSTWYDAADADDFVRYIKEHTVTPAEPNTGGAPTLRTRYTYQSLPSLPGAPVQRWSTPDVVTQLQVQAGRETELQRTAFTHINEPGNAFLHGRVQRQTATMNDLDTVTDYAYSKLDGPELAESVLQTVETLTGFDHGKEDRHVKKVITLQHSLLNGEPLLNRDDNDVQIRYAYDALRRVISETVAPGTEFEATRHYEYQLCAATGDQAEQRLFDVKNVKTCTRFDGLNRAIYEERENADSPSRAKELRQVYAARYDAWGQLVEETEYDWMDDDDWLENRRVMTSRFEYDDWGAQRCVIGPDGVKTFEETDPVGTDEWEGVIQRTWSEGAGTAPLTTGVTVTWLNLFEKPKLTERFDLNKQLTSRHEYGYDGLGRTTKETVGIGPVLRNTLYSYDAFDRLVENTLPLGAVVRRSFAAHTSEDLPSKISVDNIELGEQMFDGLGRIHESITGGRRQVFTFEPGQTQPKTVTTPGGQVIEYVYQPQLGTEPVQRRLPSAVTRGAVDEARYEYDQHNARLLVCEEQGLKLTRDYFSTGEVKREVRLVEDGEYTMDYRYSRMGRLLGYTDVLRQEQSYKYDALARLQETRLGTTVSTFTYDSLGQTKTIHTSDSLSGQHVTIKLDYDEFGRETLRTFDLNGVEQTLSQVYNDVDGLTKRTLKQGTELLREEDYEYDLRGRLTKYSCAGSQRPVDPYDKVINSQLFNFDALDNLKYVVTAYDGGSNRATYLYENTDKVQLSKVTNTASNAGYPAQILLEYNEDGHLVRDEESRTLEYDSLGRLLSVSGNAGETPRSYHYDPLDALAGDSDGQGREQRFYRGGKDGELANQVKGANSSTFMRGDGVVLAEHQAGADPKSVMLASDNKNTLLQEISNGTANAVVHTAYGYTSAELPISAHLQYNGEFSEPQTGWQLLGNGYRAYNSSLMRFHSPDSMSPFGKGGINAYMYVSGNPITYLDRSGHWKGGLMRALKIPTAGNRAAKRYAESMQGLPRNGRVDGEVKSVDHYKKHYDGRKKTQRSMDETFKNDITTPEASRYAADVEFNRVLDDTRAMASEVDTYIDRVASGRIFAKDKDVDAVVVYRESIWQNVADNFNKHEVASITKLPEPPKVVLKKIRRPS